MRFFSFLLLVVLSMKLNAQCFDIQSILVDACAGSQEGQNEMVIFKVGSTALNTSNMSVTWPNNSWLGLTQNAGTAADIATVNATILGCGFLKEPVAGVLPANSKVLLVTSTAWTPLAQSFVNLTDTLIVIFQTAGNTAGHFANYTAGGGLRTLTISFSTPAGCTDAVTYDRSLLIKQNQAIGAQDGGAVEFTPSGTATYVNHGCQAPFIPLSVDAGADHTICTGSTQTLSATSSGIYTTVNWSLGAGATGSFSPSNSLTTTYSPGSGDNGTVKLYCTLSKACGTQTTTVKDSTNITLLQIPNPVISAASTTICSGSSTTLSYSLTNAANTGTTSAVWSPGGATTTGITVNSTNVYSVQVSNGCGSNTSTISVSTVPVPSITISAQSLTACPQATVGITANSNVGNYSWSNPVSTNPAVVLSSNTTTTGIVTTSNVCGSDTKTYTLTITPSPTVSVDNANAGICAGQSVTITATSNAATYTWSPGGINTNTISLGTAGVYTVSSSNVCGSASATVDVSVQSLPTLSLTSSSPSMCATGQTVTLSASGSAGSYLWSDGANTFSTSVTSPGVYTATVTTSSCGTAVSSVTVGTIPLPTVSISAPSATLCNGSSLTFTANASSGNYLWSDGTTTQTISVSTSSIAVTTTNVCGSAQATQTISIIPVPTVSVSSASVALCSGQTATIQASSNTSVTYSWSTGGNNSAEVLGTAGVYTVSVSNACGSASETVAVTTGTAPSISATATQTVLCGSQSATLTVSGSPGSVLWSNSATTNSIVVNAAGNYSVTVSNSCGTATAAVLIQTDNIPVINATASQTLLCGSQTATLAVTGSTGSVLWSNSATTNSTVVSAAGTYSVAVTNVCGTGTAAVTVTTSAQPSISIVPTRTLLCGNQSSLLTLTGSQGNIIWSTSATSSPITVNTAGVYSATLTNACGTATADVSITASPNPTVSINPPSAALCSGHTATLTATGNTGNYSWSTGDNTNTIYTNNTGVYTVSVTNACGTKTASVTVVPLSFPSLTLTATSNSICPGETATLTVSGGVPLVTGSPLIYGWSNSASTGSVVTTSGGTITVSNTNVCGTNTASIIVDVIPVNASIVANPASGVKPLLVNFTNNSSGASVYAWDFGNGNTASTQTVSPQTYSSGGTYWVYLYASNGACSDLDSVMITVYNEEPGLIIPNVFTPNGDSANDVFKVRAFNIIDFECIIYDRWGLEMYRWNGVAGGWDGKANGKDVPEGTYFYLIQAKDINNKDIKKQGTVNLFK